MYDFEEEAKTREAVLTLEEWHKTEKLKGNKMKAEKIHKLLIKKNEERRQRDKKA
jgi:hypothetical protein